METFPELQEDHAAGSLRRVPWQTPHTYEVDGELRLTDAARGWLEKERLARGRLADEARAAAGMSDLKATEAPRARMAAAQKVDPSVDGLAKQEWPRLAQDGVLEVRVPGALNADVWVPYVPVGEAVPGTDWRKWIFLQAHVGVFGGHRLTEQTMAILKRIARWPAMRKDVA
eukprot:8345778-Alexandrium_andersonii.AAC.1